MPPVFDRRTLTADKDPLQGLLDFTNVDEIIGQAGNAIRDTITNLIKHLTGLDLSSPEAFFTSFIELINNGPAQALEFIESILAQLITSIHDLTGLNLTSPEAFFASLIDLVVTTPQRAEAFLQGLFGALTDIPGAISSIPILSDFDEFVEGFFEAFDDLDLSQGPAAIANAIADALSDIPILGDIVEAITGGIGGLEDLAEWALSVPKLVGGLLNGSWIPSLDASKIVGGQFLESLIPILSIFKIPNLPFSHIVGDNPLDNSSFDDNLDSWTIFGGGWSHDPAIGAARPGSVKALGDGTFNRDLTSERFDVDPGDEIPVSAKVRWAGFTSTAPDSIQLAATLFDAGGNPVGYPVIAAVGPTGTQTGWQTISGTLTIPPGVAKYAVRLSMRSSGTGDAWFDDIHPAMPGSGLDLVEVLSNFPILGDLVKVLTGVVGGTFEDLQEWASRVPLLNIVTGFLSGSWIPQLDASKIVGGQFLESLIPNLDPAKITGLVAQLGTFLTAASNLNAAKLVGLVASLIPQLDASKIVGGQFLESLIPQLAQTKITGLVAQLGTFLTAASNLDAGKLINLVASLIPQLDASKIVGGTFLESLIPMLPQARINGLVAQLGTFLTAASNLDATKLVGLVASLIPQLDATKIATGLLSTLRIPQLSRTKIIGTNDLSNALEDGGFESPDTVNPTNGTIVTITDPALGGTKALQLNSTGGNVDASVAPGLIETKPGQWWYVKGRLRKITTGTVGQAGIYLTFRKDGASPSYPSFSAVPGGLTTPTFNMSDLTQNVWVEFEGIYQTPADKNQVFLRPSVRSSVPTGQTVQYDDLELREVTMQRSVIDEIAAAWGQTGQSLTTIFNNIPVGKLVGQIAAALIPSLDASKITGGQFLEALIPTLSQAKVTITSIAGNLISSVIAAANIPGLDASKINGGTFGDARIPGLNASKIIAGLFPMARIGINDFENLVGDGGFESDTTMPWTVATGRGRVTDEAHSGTGSYNFSAGATGASFTGGTIELREGDMIYAEVWVKKDASYNATDARVRMAAGRPEGDLNMANLAFTPAAINAAATAQGVANTDWVKLSGTYGPYPANTFRMALSLVMTNLTAGNVWIDDLVIRRVKAPETIAGLPGTKIISQILSAIVPSLDASKITGGQLLEAVIPTLQQAKVNIVSIAGNIISSVIAAANIPGLDASKITGGTLNDGRIPSLNASKINAGTFADARIPSLAQAKITGLPDILTETTTNVRNVVDGIVNSLQGVTGTYWQQSEANDALSSVAKAQAAAAQAIAEIQADRNQQATNGVSRVIQFEQFANSTNMPSVFTQTYIPINGSAVAKYGISGGVAKATNNADFNEETDIICEYNQLDTLTNIQRVGAVWADPPGKSYQNPTPFFTPTPYYGPYWAWHTLYARYRDVNNWVRVLFSSSNVARLQCCVNGTITQFGSDTNHTFQPGTLYWLEAGTAGNARTFRVIAGSKIIITYTDSAAVSGMSSLHRSGAIGAKMCGTQALGAPANPGSLVAMVIQDNAVVGMLGASARFSRSLTASVTHGASGVKIADSFFNNVDYNTGQFDWSPTNNNRITLNDKGEEGMYMVRLNILRSSSSDVFNRVAMYKNNVLIDSAQSLPYTINNGVFAVYLKPDDYIEPGVIMASSTGLTGETSGLQASLQITKMG